MRLRTVADDESSRRTILLRLFAGAGARWSILLTLGARPEIKSDPAGSIHRGQPAAGQTATLEGYRTEPVCGADAPILVLVLCTVEFGEKPADTPAIDRPLVRSRRSYGAIRLARGFAIKTVCVPASCHDEYSVKMRIGRNQTVRGMEPRRKELPASKARRRL
jgi:hypothetical protein